MAYSGTANTTGAESVMDEVITTLSSHTARLLALATLSLGSINSSAVEYGIGISLLEDGAAIYAPINIGSHWRIEPIVSLERTETDQDNEEAFYRELALGAGGFYRYPLSKHNTEVYVGTRISLLRRDETAHVSTALNRIRRMDAEYRGYQSNALVGIDYYFSSAFSIGGEVGLEHTEYDVEFDDNMMGNDKANVSDTRTRSNLIARYYF